MTRHSIRSGEQGVALLIALAFVVLLSGLVVAYFSRTTVDLQLSNSSVNQSRADELARSALDIITGTLKQEIANANPNADPDADVTTPVRNVQLSGTICLIRISAPTTIAAPAVDYLASNASSSGISANGRSISLARWNKHYLLPRDPAKYSGSNKEGTDPLPGFTAPSWVYVTNKGPAVLTSPNRSVVGRYAYAMYDEGALLDVNVAGYPKSASGSTSTTGTHMGSLAFADLTVLGLSSTTAVNNIVGWRNYASAKPEGNLTENFTFSPEAVTRYAEFVLSNTDGLLKASGAPWNGRTDQVFLTRQELIAFSKTTSGKIIPLNYLHYFGTFNRAYGPAMESGTSVDYAAPFLKIIESRQVAGTLNLNSACPKILQTVIDGAIIDASLGLTGRIDASHKSKSASLAVAIGGKPLGTGEEFVTCVWGAIDTVLSGTTSTRNKAYGEATLHALSCVRNTRTWNLMIDVVAQTGVFPPNVPSTGAALNSSFVVQGERRYWLHIAIDRVTGKVIDQQLEAVYE